MDLNPWNIQSIFELQYFLCPVCPFKNGCKQDIVNHAFETHSESVNYLTRIEDGSLDDVQCPWESEVEVKDEFPDEDPLFESQSPLRAIEKPKSQVKIVFGGAKLSICDNCGKTFTNSVLLSKHILEVHNTVSSTSIKKKENKKLVIQVNENVQHSEENLSKVFQCPICQEIFSNFYKLADHKEKVHAIVYNERPQNCRECRMPMSSFYSTEDHDKHCQTLEQKICEVCGIQIQDLSKLKNHRNKVHKVARECNICFKMFPTFYQLSQHFLHCHFGYKMVYENVQLYCDYCEKRFETRHQMFQHFESIHSGDQMKCPKCEERFDRTENLIPHLTQNHANKIYICLLCDEEHSSLDSIEIHISLDHKDEKESTIKHRCKRCQKRFDTAEILSEHMKTCDTVNTCHICGATLVSPTVLKKHLESVHEKIKNHPCDKCNQAFYSKTCLNQHIAAVHEGIKNCQCDTCGKEFFSKQSLKAQCGNYANLVSS